MDKINYQEEVQKVYPHAVSANIDYGIGIFENKDKIPEWICIGSSKFNNASTENAWKSAYEKIINKQP